MHNAVLDSYMIEHNNPKSFNYLLGKGGYFLVALVCLSVCLFVCGHHYSKSYEWIGVKFKFYGRTD